MQTDVQKLAAGPEILQKCGKSTDCASKGGDKIFMSFQVGKLK